MNEVTPGRRALVGAGLAAMAGTAVAMTSRPAHAEPAPTPADTGYAPPPRPDKDDTETIREAARTGKRLHPGDYYFKAPALDLDNIRLIGDGAGRTTIVLQAGKYLIDANRRMSGMHIEGIRFLGGAGMYRNSYTGENVSALHTVRGCEFRDYTGAAISHSAMDMPYWAITDCMFWAAKDTPSMGIALQGLTDGARIANNKFLSNKVHVKLGHGGNNAYLSDNDFIHFTDGAERVMVWVVPAPKVGVDKNQPPANAGSGLVITRCKFGNEHQMPDDFRIVYANEGPGAHFGDRLPDLRGRSEGFIRGHHVSECYFAGAGETTAAPPVVFSTTPLVSSGFYGNFELGGTRPAEVFRFLEPPTRSQFQLQGSIFGPISSEIGGPPMRASNSTAHFHVVDPNQLFGPQPGVALHHAGGTAAGGYSSCLRTRVREFERLAGTTLTPVPDSVGGQDAALVKLGTGDGWLVSHVKDAASCKVGVPTWVEFELRRAAGPRSPSSP